ncbi:hypothetical protein JW921_02725 [Candidatus Fermentibacterales bacterium]|nr:hypothetical protein [Candidatus Fermentibacterales bacterium]
MRSLAAILTTGLLAMTLAPVAGAGIPELFYEGNPWPGCSARALGMSQSALDLSPMGALSNPALLARAPSGLSVSLSGGLGFDIERRSVRVYDSFGSLLGESETAYNQGADFVPAGLALSLRGVDWLPEALAIGFGWRVPRSFDYEYSRILRSESYVKTGEEILSSSGRINEVSVALGLIPSEALGFGLGAGYVTGGRNLTWEERYVDPTIEDVLISDSHDITGLVARGSVQYAPLARLSLIAGVEKHLSYEHGDGITPGGTVELPLRLSLGGIYVPGSRLRTTFTGSVYWSGDSQAEYAGTDMGLDDSWGVSAGVEHLIPAGPAVRFGFGFDRSPISRALDAVRFSAGMGFRLSDWDLDLGLSFSPRRWRKASVPDLFPYTPSSDFPSPSFEEGDSLSVEESSTMILISIGRSFEL